MSFITGPIPAYQNLPIEAQYYQPSRFVISGITLGVTTTITTTVPTNYQIGQAVRLIIPPTFGTRQLNEQQGVVLSFPSSTQVVLNIDSRNFDAFKSSTATTKPEILAIGDINSGPTNANGPMNQQTYIPASFINISPN